VPVRVGLAARLRSETADLHGATEATVGIPDAVRTVDDYAMLLRSSRSFYAGAADALADARWRQPWTRLGVRLEAHTRLALIDDDLAALGQTKPAIPPHRLASGSFAEVLGLLYVVEGSALGGHLIAPAIVAAIGPVPTSFYLGRGRDHPRPWRRVLSALAEFDRTEVETDPGLANEVVRGARRAFLAFGETVSSGAVAAAPGVTR